MEIKLPPLGKKPVDFLHFPTMQQAFIFRAYEYVPVAKIAKILEASEDNVRKAAAEMGLKKECTSDIWLKKGYITIVRRLWHILPYEQLLELLEFNEEEFAIILREEDFLDLKLGAKPVCEVLKFRELTAEEKEQTRFIKEIVEKIDLDGKEPFDFVYDVADMKFSGEQCFDMRMVYGFSGLYQKAFDVDSREYCPDSMLEAYRKTGVNALWTQGVLYQLSEFPFNKKLSEGYKERLARLKDLTERCDKYGIKIFLYLNEPRSMPESFFEEYPELRGHNAKNDKICMCTSTKPVQDYLTDSVEFICREVPKIGGFFTITRSENPTNCFSHAFPAENCTCERCKKRGIGEVIGETIGCIEKGAHRVDPNIKVIAWSWAWDIYNIDIINHLPKNVILMSQSEKGIPFEINGVKGEVRDYSMSILGPGELAKAEWKAARERGLELAAKVQINTTWEGSTAPAIPVYPLIEEHIRRIKAEGVKNLMLSWTLGGFPSRNIMHVAKYFYENCDESALNESETVKRATECFSEAFRDFPFNITVLYQGPQNAGPSTLLFLNPTGYRSTMTCYAYDDINNWCNIYPRDIFDAQLSKLCSKWEKGLALLEKERNEKKNGEYSELDIMACAAYCLFRSSLNLFRFYIAREADDKDAMIREAQNEIASASEMLKMMNLNPAVGFEAANHYYFSKGCLCEKILNCHDVIRRLKSN